MSAVVSSPDPRARSSLTGILLEFLGSMNLAITLLMVVGIASVIGMVLQQGQSYGDYLLQFGPFWFQVFRDLGLYNVYSAGWFVFILAFLTVSTSVCIVRNGPGMLREMRQFRMNVQAKSLRLMRYHVERETAVDADAVRARAERLLRNHGYRVREAAESGGFVLAGMNGASNRLGYLLTHIGLVVILLSGVIDGNLPLQITMALHGLRVETKDIPASEVPSSSRLAPGTLAFRGDVSIPVGSTTDVLFLDMDNGYLVQKLPFMLTMKKFTVERFAGGQPKNFVSDVVLHDPSTGKTLQAKVSDNHPLMYHGYDIYQTSFGDGGSHLNLRLWSLGDGKPRVLDGRVFKHYEIKTDGGERRLELDNFRMFNVRHVPGGKAHTKVDDMGPSVTFKVRRPDGVAREYVNYYRPQVIGGRLYYLSGVRSSPAENYRFLRIPAGPHGGVRRFMQLVGALHDQGMLHKAAALTASSTEQTLAARSPALSDRVDASVYRLLDLFAKGGYTAVLEDVHRRVPAAKQEAVAGAFVQVLNVAMENLYGEVLQHDGITTPSKKDLAWLQAALPALGVLSIYGSPFYVQLADFRQVEASGLQITHYPATGVAFFGSAMLMIGILLMFFVSHRRVWLRIQSRADGRTSVLFAGTSNRHQQDFGRQFERLESQLFARLTD